MRARNESASPWSPWMQREIAVIEGLIHGKRSVALLGFSRLLPESSLSRTCKSSGRYTLNRCVCPYGARKHVRRSAPPDRIQINCPYLLSSETTAKGTGLEKLAGKGDLVELDSSLAL